MRATYEDLLRTARRIAVSAQRGIYPDEPEVLADWQAVLSATKYHLRWLRGRLRTEPWECPPGKRSDNALGRVAQAIGAAADLLAVQDAAAATALNVGDDLIAARSEVAAIALTAAKVVFRNTRSFGAERTHLRSVMHELVDLARSDLRRTGLGGLAVLAAGGPAVLADDRLMIAPAAARWERAHASMPPEAVLTRDLRSTTAQLRTVGGYVWQVANHLLSAPTAALDAGQRLDLKVIRSELQSFGASVGRVESIWRRRVSDLSGQSDSQGEVAFLDLKGAVDRVLRDDRARGLVSDHRTAAEFLDVADELLWCTEQVSRHQQRAVSWLIGAGRLFVPRHEAARVDICYLRRPVGGSRPLQAKWVRTDLAGCFDELRDDLADAADHLKAAAGVARRLAGTSALSRRTAERGTRTPQPYVDGTYWIADPGQEFAGLIR